MVGKQFVALIIFEIMNLGTESSDFQVPSLQLSYVREQGTSRNHQKEGAFPTTSILVTFYP